MERLAPSWSVAAAGWSAERYYNSHVDDHAEVRSVTKSVMAI
jgi:hypothetical protein